MVIGGIGTIEGPIIGVIVFFLLQNTLADYGTWYLLLLGLIGIVVMLFAPRGLWGLFADRTGIQLFPVRRRIAGGPFDHEEDLKEEAQMADITTDVLIIGTGPAGSATAALLSTYGVENMVVNRYRWLANTPRAHITNQRAMEVLRDLGPEVEAEAYLYATEQDLMGENIFCTSLAGEELGRMRSWGKHPLSRAAHQLASPSLMNDLPQTFMEPILFKTACSRGTQARMSTEYLSHVQDADGVTTTCRDRLTGKDITIRSKYLVGADGGKSLVAEHAGLPFAGKMGVGGSMNILFKADLSKYVAHRPSVLYWVLQPGSNVGGIGMGLVRMVRPWNEWLIVWGYDINEGEPKVDEAFATKVARDLVGDPKLEIELQSVSTWTVNNLYATEMSKGRVFCMGDATHRHPPSNGLGSNTSIQDGFNLAWKLAYVLKGQAGPKLLDSYSAERAPVAKQIVTRANQSIEEFGPIFKALGLLDSIDPVKMQENMDARCDDTARRRGAARGDPQGDRLQGLRVRRPWRRHEPALQLGCGGHRRPARAALRAATASSTTSRRPGPARACPMSGSMAATGGRPRPSTSPGKGRFAIFTGIGGEGWIEAGARGRQGARHRHRRLRHRPAPGLGGLRRRLGQCARGGRQRHRAGPPRPACRLAARSHRRRSGRRTPPRPQDHSRQVSVMATEEQGYFTEANSADVVISRNRNAKDERLKAVMAVITRKLHEAVKEIEPTQDEWIEGDPVPHPHRPDVQRVAAGVHPPVGRHRRLDAGRRDQQPEAVRRLGEHGARTVPRRRRARAADGRQYLPRPQGRGHDHPRPHPRHRGQADRGRDARRVAGQ